MELALPEISAAIRAHWIGVLYRDEGWQVLHEIGTLGGSRRMPPPHWLADVCDRGDGCYYQTESSGDFLAVPLRSERLGTEVLAAGVSGVEAAVLRNFVVAARVLGTALQVSRQRQRNDESARRSKALIEIARGLAAVQETLPLLERLASDAARLLQADRASIFLWDRPQKQLIARPALGVEGGELRVADQQGVVGRVVHTRQPVRVDDVSTSADFSPQVDRRLGYQTRNLICVPLLAASGECLGAFQVLNKHAGVFSDADVADLAELAAFAVAALQNVQEREALLHTQRHLTEQAAQGAQIIGGSPAIAALRGMIDRLAPTDLPVLILGESGTGKEVVSRALHFQSLRRQRPFLPVNCAALSETLLESELFGHEKGAFTDARESRQGKFELASGGTLFLDEIGDLSLGGQAKLLRVLEEKVVYRVGGSQPVSADTRVIAATNRDLAEAVRERKFRQDLLFRLSVVTLTLPPLRERTDDVIPLAEFFLARFCRDAKRKPLGISSEAKRRLQEHAWPGNVRELRNMMERLAFLGAGPNIEAHELSPLTQTSSVWPASTAETTALPDVGWWSELSSLGLAEATDAFQRRHIQAALDRAGPNLSEAARALGLHRSNFYRKLRQLGMTAGD